LWPNSDTTFRTQPVDFACSGLGGDLDLRHAVRHALPETASAEGPAGSSFRKAGFTPIICRAVKAQIVASGVLAWCPAMRPNRRTVWPATGC